MRIQHNGRLEFYDRLLLADPWGTPVVSYLRWTSNDGHAERDEVRVGINDGRWVEVTNLHRSTASGPDLPRVPVNGPERVILGDLSILADGGPVEGCAGLGRVEGR